MIIYLKYTNGKKKSTQRKLQNLDLFSTIKLYTKNTFKLETKTHIRKTEKKKIQDIEKALLEISTSKPELYYNPESVEKTLKTFHIFADIDSTLTHNGIRALHRNVKSHIERINEAESNFYFCSGRSSQEIDELRRRYDTGEYAIAENGGIIIGMLNGGDLGSMEHPNKLLKYLAKHRERINFKIDIRQKNRKTELILLKNSINEKELKKAIRNSKAEVDCHTSKDAYHISKKGVNKGSAIEALTGDELKLDPDLNQVVAIGDSELDVAMFKYAEKAFIVGKPGKELAKKIKPFKNKVTELPLPPDAIEEMYKILFPYS